MCGSLAICDRYVQAAAVFCTQPSRRLAVGPCKPQSPVLMRSVCARPGLPCMCAAPCTSAAQRSPAGCRLLFKSDGNSRGLPCIMSIAPLTPDGLQLAGPATDILRNDLPWEAQVIEVCGAAWPYSMGAASISDREGLLCLPASGQPVVLANTRETWLHRLLL